MPPRRKTTPTRRRSKPKVSLIQTAASLAVLNGWSNATVGMGLIPFFTEGWFGRKKSASSDNSWEISLHEMVQQLTGATSNYGGSSSYGGGAGGALGAAIKKNFKDNAANAIAMTVAVPLAVGVGQRLARKQINQVNRLAAPVFKPLGVKL